MSVAKRQIPGGGVLIDKTPAPKPLRRFVVAVQGRTDGNRLMIEGVQIAGVSALEASAIFASVQLRSPVAPVATAEIQEGETPGDEQSKGDGEQPS